VSVSDLVHATLARIEATEPLIHAFSSVSAEAAQERAGDLDAELGEGRWRGPLHGIPVAAKDLFFTADAPTEAGSEVLQGFLAPHDATAIRLLRNSGAVVIGKTTMHEFAYAHNALPTRNPWDPDFLPGGSSAGSAAAVAARSAFGALGTDTGGSVRIPAAATGVVGLKPTFGLISKHGVVPLSWSLDHVGILSRTVGDCAAILQAIARVDPLDPGSIESSIPNYGDDLAGPTRGARLGLPDFFLYEGVSEGVRRAFHDAARELERLGATIVEVSVPELELMAEIGWTIVLAEASSWHRRLVRTSGEKYTAGTRFTLELGELISAPHYLAAQRARRTARDGVRRVFEEQSLDALIGPTSPVTATRADQSPTGPSGAEEPNTQLELHHSFPANLTGQPAISVPCGFDDAGLPVGLQIIGRPFDESMILRLAAMYEAANPWHERVPPAVLEVTQAKPD